MNINCTVKNMSMTCDERYSVRASRGVLHCKFIFATEDWNDTEKYAVFLNTVSGISKSAVIGEDGICLVPWECLATKGRVEFSAAGERGNGYRIPTNTCNFLLLDSLPAGEDSRPPTPNLYLQRLALKADLPQDENGNPVYGDKGQVLTSNGDGTNEWKTPQALDDEDEVLSYRTLEKRIEVLEKNSCAGASGTTEKIELVDMTSYLLKSGGNVVATSSANENRIVSEPVYAKEGETYLFTCSANYGNALYVIYDTAGESIGQVVADATVEGNVLKQQRVTMPENTNYFRLACNKDILAEGYSAHKVVKENNNNIPLSPLKGKKWVAVGDSVTEKNIRTSKNYHDYIAEETGITVVNMGAGGTGYKNGEEENIAFYQRVEDIPEDADIITIFGSGNDRNLELGSVTDTDTNTVCGCINTTIDTIHQRAPTAWMGIITPTPWMNFPPYEAENKIAKLSQALVEICERRGIPCLDLYHCSGLRPWDEDFRKLAYSKDDGDGTHPDETGHAMIYPQIRSFLLGGANSTNAMAISKLSEEIANIGKPTDEQVTNAVNAYLEENPIEGGTVVASVEPMEDDIPKVFLNGDEFANMTKDKNEVNMELDYMSKTKAFHSYIKIKFQGSSSLSKPKKNFTIKMYSDEIRETKMKLVFKDWATESNKYVLKANYIDHTHARNIVSARLWSDIVESRSDYESLPIELRTSPNNGVVDGFPIKVYVNGVYQGLYTWNIPKDGWMNNMDEALDTHCMLCGASNYVTSGENPCAFRSASVSGWTDELHDTMPDTIKSSWTNFISFVMNSTDEEFVANAENYFDVQSVIDFCIFTRIDAGLDSIGKNQMFFTYDGVKWIESVYDKDSTWGINVSGYLIENADILEFQTDYAIFTEGGKTNLLYERVEFLFLDKLKSRYAELRSGVLSVSNIITKFERFTDVIGNDLYNEDTEPYNIPSATTSNIQQIRKFVVKRLAYMDGVINALTVPIYATGITLNQTTITIQGENAVTLIANVTPSDSTETVYWESSDKKVATVENGVVTSVQNGSCIITATVGNYSANCTVTVIDIPEKPTLTSISATYAGEEVAIGSSLNGLTGITVIATYSDGSTKEVTDYTLSGEIAGESNTITVTYNGLTTTIMVIGVANALVYSLEETTFDGQNIWFDTGYEPLAINNDWTILFDATPSVMSYISSLLEAGGGDFKFRNVSSEGGRYTCQLFGVSVTTVMTNTETRFKVALRYNADTESLRCLTNTVESSVIDRESTVTWKATEGNLIIGTNLNRDAFWKGKIHDLRIYNYGIADDELTEYVTF